MAVPPLKARLSHVLDAIAQIEKNTKGITLRELQRDRFRQLGIERCLEIISEASRYIPDDVKLRYDEVPWRRIADIGNRLRHAYHAVDSAIVWEIVIGELPQFCGVIERIANESSGREH
jgi:uncharacterized protein with HEPN domain